MRPIWKGTLSFGLVNIPVQLAPAVRREETISFRQLHGADHAPIRYERVCTRDGAAVPWADIVKGYEYTKGKFVILTEADLGAAVLESSKVFEIVDFVAGGDIDPRYFDTPYYLLPARGGEKPYALLREAVRRTNMVGIGKITMRANAQHLAGVRVVGDALVLELMRFAAEIVPVGEYTFPGAEAVRPQELQMAEALIGNLAQPFTPDKYRDEYHESLMRVIRAKLKGKKVAGGELVEPEGTKVVDLMARLQASLAKTEGGTRAPRPRAPAKQASSRRTRARPRKSA